MNRLEYINNLLTESRFRQDENNIIYALIMALTPKQACDFLDLSFEQDYKVRQWIVKKIAIDIGKSYQGFHQEIVSNLLEMVNQKPFPKRNSCAYSIDTLSENLPIEQQDDITLTFLNSSYIQIRNRAYKRLSRNWNDFYQSLIQKNWEKYHDTNCISIIVQNFSTEFLLNNYTEYIDHFKPYQLAKLFLRLSEEDFNIVDELKQIDEISYAYVLTKLGKFLTLEQSKQILSDNYQDKRIGLLIWCFGQMGLWDAIVDFDKNYKEKIRQLTSYIDYGGFDNQVD